LQDQPVDGGRLGELQRDHTGAAGRLPVGCLVGVVHIARRESGERAVGGGDGGQRQVAVRVVHGAAEGDHVGRERRVRVHDEIARVVLYLGGRDVRADRAAGADG